MNEMTALPIDQLICSPIIAAAKAQSQLTAVTIDFIERICSLKGVPAQGQAT